MQCTRCGVWELAAGDLACSWCGASYLRFTAALHPAELPAEDYPPPVELEVHNDSPLGSLSVEVIQPDVPWITLLPGQALPYSLAPGARHRFLLDVDAFAAGARREATVFVSATYAAEAQTATLHLRPAETVAATR